VYAPLGWRGPVPTIATLGGNTVAQCDCPSATMTEFGWQHYALGVAPA